MMVRFVHHEIAFSSLFLCLVCCHVMCHVWFVFVFVFCVSFSLSKAFHRASKFHNQVIFCANKSHLVPETLHPSLPMKGKDRHLTSCWGSGVKRAVPF